MLCKHTPHVPGEPVEEVVGPAYVYSESPVLGSTEPPTRWVTQVIRTTITCTRCDEVLTTTEVGWQGGDLETIGAEPLTPETALELLTGDALMDLAATQPDLALLQAWIMLRAADPSEAAMDAYDRVKAKAFYSRSVEVTTSDHQKHARDGVSDPGCVFCRRRAEV